MQYTLARFDPLGDRDPELSDQHYREVHIRLAIELLGSVPAIRQYSTYRVRRQYDATGHWNKLPSAWRFATQIIDVTGGSAGEEAATAFPEEVRQRLAQDHRNCLRHLRRFDVEDLSLVEVSPQPSSSQRYFFEFERRPDVSGEEARAAYERVVAEVRDLASDGPTPGLRRMVRRAAFSEAETTDLDDVGQLLTGRLLGATTMVGYLDVQFDSHYSAEPFFARREVREALRDPHFSAIEGYEVAETIGFDKRVDPQAS